MKYTVARYSDVFKCHPKTILRAVTGQPHPSDWHPDDIDHNKVAKAFNMRPTLLEACMMKKDSLIDVDEATRILGISVRRFHQRRENERGYESVAHHGRIVRYLRSAIEAMNDDL